MADPEERGLIGSDGPNWGAISALFASSLIFALWDGIIGVFSTVQSSIAWLVERMFASPADIPATIWGRMAEVWEAAWAESAASLPGGPLSFVFAILVLTATFSILVALMERMEVLVP